MAEMRISNTLVNDEESQVLAYARQLLDSNFYGENKSERQSVINQKLVQLRKDFDALIGSEEGDADDIINAFKEIEEFLKDYKEGSTLTTVIEGFLKPLKESILSINSVLAIELDTSTGELKAIHNSTTTSLSDKSRINPKTGKVELVFNF